MKIANFVIGMILFFTTLFTLLFAEVVIVTGVTFQAGDENAIVYYWDKEDSDRVVVTDVFYYWGTEVVRNLDNPPKERIRQWFSWDWWQTASYLPDLVIDKFVCVFKPVALPLRSIGEIARYGNASIYDDHLLQLIADNQTTSIGMVKAELDGLRDLDLSTVTYSRWLNEGNEDLRKEIDNVLFKLSKYNHYESSDECFILYTKSGIKFTSQEVEDQYDIYEAKFCHEGTVKGAVYILYIAFYGAVFGAWFVLRQNPICLDRDEATRKIYFKGSLLPKLVTIKGKIPFRRRKVAK